MTTGSTFYRIPVQSNDAILSRVHRQDLLDLEQYYYRSKNGNDGHFGAFPGALESI